MITFFINLHESEPVQELQPTELELPKFGIVHVGTAVVGGGEGCGVGGNVGGGVGCGVGGWVGSGVGEGVGGGVGSFVGCLLGD